MYWKNAFIYTQRETPAEAEVESHKLMLRSGMIMKLASGIYDYLPLGLRVIRKIEGIIREEMERAGSAELLMPAVVPAHLWRESGRWDVYGSELLRLKDRKQNDYCIGPTHEEVIVDIARRAVKSYKDLPLSLYQVQNKFRDEIRPRFGLMRGREFIMKDAYSFHADDACLEETYQVMKQAYTRIFSRMGLEFRPVEADSGAIGGDVTHEFHVLADSGEDKIIYCTACDYAANVEKAAGQVDDSFAPGTPDVPEHVHTPGLKTIEEVSDFLSVTPAETAKMLVFKKDGDELVAVLIRGDLQLNEVKFRNCVAAEFLEIPEENELREAGLVPGYLGPLDLDIPVYADYSVKQMSSCICGANRGDYHLKNVSPARDLADLSYADFSFVDAGDICSCGAQLSSCRGIEVGQVFKLQKKYTTAMDMTFLDTNGKAQTPTMGCYGIGVGRTAAAAIEQNNDADGIIWPTEIAPFTIHVLALDPQDEMVSDLMHRVHDYFESRGVDVLLDDRKERPGVKFKDADLIGCPWQVILGKRGLKKGTVEIKERKSGEKTALAPKQLVATLEEFIG